MTAIMITSISGFAQGMRLDRAWTNEEAKKVADALKSHIESLDSQDGEIRVVIVVPAIINEHRFEDMNNYLAVRNSLLPPDCGVDLCHCMVGACCVYLTSCVPAYSTDFGLRLLGQYRLYRDKEQVRTGCSLPGACLSDVCCGTSNTKLIEYLHKARELERTTQLRIYGNRLLMALKCDELVPESESSAPESAHKIASIVTEFCNKGVYVLLFVTESTRRRLCRLWEDASTGLPDLDELKCRFVVHDGCDMSSMMKKTYPNGWRGAIIFAGVERAIRSMEARGYKVMALASPPRFARIIVDSLFNRIIKLGGAGEAPSKARSVTNKSRDDSQAETAGAASNKSRRPNNNCAESDPPTELGEALTELEEGVACALRIAQMLKQGEGYGVRKGKTRLIELDASSFPSTLSQDELKKRLADLWLTTVSTKFSLRVSCIGDKPDIMGITREIQSLDVHHNGRQNADCILTGFIGANYHDLAQQIYAASVGTWGDYRNITVVVSSCEELLSCLKGRGISSVHPSCEELANAERLFKKITNEFQAMEEREVSALDASAQNNTAHVTVVIDAYSLIEDLNDENYIAELEMWRDAISTRISNDRKAGEKFNVAVVLDSNAETWCAKYSDSVKAVFAQFSWPLIEADLIWKLSELSGNISVNAQLVVISANSAVCALYNDTISSIEALFSCGGVLPKVEPRPHPLGLAGTLSDAVTQNTPDCGGDVGAEGDRKSQPKEGLLLIIPVAEATDGVISKIVELANNTQVQYKVLLLSRQWSSGDTVIAEKISAAGVSCVVVSGAIGGIIAPYPNWAGLLYSGESGLADLLEEALGLGMSVEVCEEELVQSINTVVSDNTFKEKEPGTTTIISGSDVNAEKTMSALPSR